MPSRLEYVETLVSESSREQCVPWPFALNGSGYGIIRTENGRQMNAHRYVLARFQEEEAPEGLDCAHDCGNRGCVNPLHLSWKTRSDNLADMVRHDTHRRGERCNTTKLTLEQAREIKLSPLPLKEIASRFDVTKQTVSRIKRGDRWPELSGVPLDIRYQT